MSTLACEHAAPRTCTGCGATFCAVCEPRPTCKGCEYSALSAAAASQSAQSAQAKPPGPENPAVARLRRLVAEGAVLVICLVWLALAPPLPRAVAHGVLGGPRGAPAAGYDRCVANLWALGAAVRAATTSEQPPATLPEAVVGLRCPAAGKPYVYQADPTRYYLACPDPRLHEVEAIEAGPPSLSPVVTPRTGGPQ